MSMKTEHTYMEFICKSSAVFTHMYTYGTRVPFLSSTKFCLISLSYIFYLITLKKLFFLTKEIFHISFIKSFQHHAYNGIACLFFIILVATQQLLAAYTVLFDDVPTKWEKRMAKKWKHELTPYKRNVSARYSWPISALESISVLLKLKKKLLVRRRVLVRRIKVKW